MKSSSLQKPLEKILKTLQSPWSIALFLLGVFLATTAYKYGWDDQHLEIPLLKNLIDPTLYQNDYYVESLKKNFSSFFYPILSKLITVEQIPSTYFGLYLVSRYFLFFWIYKLWLTISNSKFKATACVLTFILITRIPEFMYRTFSHQEFTLAIIFSGIYYFFKNRFFLASFILGLAANFHGLYSLFPMFFLGLTLLFQIKKFSLKTLIKSCTIFLLACSPFLIWTLQNRFAHTSIDPNLTKDWVSLYYLACPQNFLFGAAPLGEIMTNAKQIFKVTQPYLYIIALFLLNVVFNTTFQKNKNALSFCIGAFFLIFVSFIFTYIYPSRFFLDLNLARNSQFLLFLLTGFTTLLIIDLFDKKNVFSVIVCTSLFFFIKLGNLVALSSIGAIFFFLGFLRLLKNNNPIHKGLSIILLILSIGSTKGIFYSFETNPYSPSIKNIFLKIILTITIGTILTFFIQQSRKKQIFQKIIWFICFGILLIQFFQFRNKRVELENSGGGFWTLQRSWESMQIYVKENTARDAMLLVPYNMEMGGFRIQSERKIICSYRDCGIVGFDYNAALEWQRRVHDIEEFKFIIKTSPLHALKNAITKYDADYIVFMKYAQPSNNISFLKKIYSNEHFSLYQVK